LERYCWNGIVGKVSLERYHGKGIIKKLNPKKYSFRPSKWPSKLKTAKNSKFPKLIENCFELVGKGGWPPISTWINCISYDN
jgi:hypothetical protein